MHSWSGAAAYSSGQRLIPHIGQISKQLAQQSVADLAPNAQLLGGVNAILIGDDGLGQDLGSLHANQTTFGFLLFFMTVPVVWKNEKMLLLSLLLSLLLLLLMLLLLLLFAIQACITTLV